MSGKKGMGLGNVNATKNPHRVYLKRRVVPQRHRWVLSLSDDCFEQIRSDLPDMSGKELKVAEGINLLWTVALLGIAEARERGFIVTLPNGQWDLQPGVKAAGNFLDKAIKGLVALGLKRRAKAIPSLADYLAEKAKESAPR